MYCKQRFFIFISFLFLELSSLIWSDVAVLAPREYKRSAVRDHEAENQATFSSSVVHMLRIHPKYTTARLFERS